MQRNKKINYGTLYELNIRLDDKKYYWDNYHYSYSGGQHIGKILETGILGDWSTSKDHHCST